MIPPEVEPDRPGAITFALTGGGEKAEIAVIVPDGAIPENGSFAALLSFLHHEIEIGAALRWFKGKLSVSSELAGGPWGRCKLIVTMNGDLKQGSWRVFGADGDGAVHAAPGDLEGLFADLRHRDAVGKEIESLVRQLHAPACRKRRGQARRALRLDADDLRAGRQVFDVRRDAGDEPGAGAGG